MTAPTKATPARARKSTNGRTPITEEAPQGPNVSVEMIYEKPTKNTVRFQATSPTAAFPTLYLPNVTIGLLGDPVKIKVTVEVLATDED